jgi:hypothetical protein
MPTLIFISFTPLAEHVISIEAKSDSALMSD